MRWRRIGCKKVQFYGKPSIGGINYVQEDIFRRESDTKFGGQGRRKRKENSSAQPGPLESGKVGLVYRGVAGPEGLRAARDVESLAREPRKKPSGFDSAKCPD